MNNKEKYRLACERHPEVPLFAQYWWMDAICVGKTWDVLLVEEKGEMLGALPYLWVRKGFLKMILQPVFSQNNGVHFFYPEGLDEAGKEAFERKVCEDILAQLKALKVDWFLQHFDPTFRQCALFEEAGYQVSERVTYIIPDISDPEELFKRFTASKQRHIRKAERNGLQVGWDMDVSSFYDFHSETLRLRGRTNFNSRLLEETVCRRAIERGQGRIISVHDVEGNLHSALFFVWDAHAAYYLIPAIHSTFKSSGASTLMVWRALQFLQGKTKAFDFEGSMDPQIANSYKQFATEKRIYRQVEKTDSVICKMYKRLKNLS